MYRKTNKYAAVCAKMREAKERLRLAGPAPVSPPELPDLRRRIVVEDYDSGSLERHEFCLYKTNRIDCYLVVVDGVIWKKRAGWSQILAGLRRALPRLRAIL
jgi:hypothetical protein